MMPIVAVTAKRDIAHDVWARWTKVLSKFVPMLPP
jgi:hypothetical protein